MVHKKMTCLRSNGISDLWKYDTHVLLSFSRFRHLGWQENNFRAPFLFSFIINIYQIYTICPALRGTRYRAWCGSGQKHITQNFHSEGEDTEEKGTIWGTVSLTFDENLWLCI